MDTKMMDFWKRQYAAVNMQSFSGQPQPQPQSQRPPPPPQEGHMEYQCWNAPWPGFFPQQQQQQQQRVVMISQGGMHSTKQTEPKPRLAKDEVELLESEFAKNPKPTTSTKRDLAGRMRVEPARINNWFQNRRAKEKQIKKTREFEAQQAGERTTKESESPEGQDSGVVSEFYLMDNIHQPVGLSSAAIGEEEGVEEQEEDEMEEDEEDEGEEEEEEEVEKKEDEEINFKSESHQSMMNEADESDGAEGAPRSLGSYSYDDSKSDGFLQTRYASPPSVTARDIPDIGTAVASASFDATVVQQDYLSTATYACRPDDLASPQHDLMTDMPGLEALEDSAYFSVPLGPSMGPSFPTEMMFDDLSADVMGGTEPVDHFEHPSPVSASQSPPPPTNVKFRYPPPPTNIAARRNLRRPPSLGPSSLRSLPHSHGPKTCVDVSRRTDCASPRPRITSASLTGRVQKVGPGPRSSFSLDRSTSLLNSIRRSGSPIRGPLNYAVSPPSPNELNALENLAPANVSDEEQGWALGRWAVSSLHNEQAINTPPRTPGLPAGLPSGLPSGLQLDFHHNVFCSQMEQPGTGLAHDEAVQTPSLCSFAGSELEYPMGQPLPGYVASQPVTPSLPMNFGPTYGFPGRGPSNVEYNFPDSFPGGSTMSSPGQPKSKIQFAQNVTPQDFNLER